MTNTDNNIADIIVTVLKKNKEGLTITALSEKIKRNRFVIRLNLARLEGANKVNMRRIGMAKLYTVRK